MGVLRSRGAEAVGRIAFAEAARRAGGYRQRRAVLRLGTGQLDHRPGAEHRRGPQVTTPLDYATAHRAEILNELMAFARIPSVSTDPAYLQGIATGAEW